MSSSLAEVYVFSFFSLFNLVRGFQILKRDEWLDGVRFKVRKEVVLFHIFASILVLASPLLLRILEVEEGSVYYFSVFAANPLSVPIFAVSLFAEGRTRDASVPAFWTSSLLLVGGVQLLPLFLGVRGLAWACCSATAVGTLIAVRGRVAGKREEVAPKTETPSSLSRCETCEKIVSDPYPRRGRGGTTSAFFRLTTQVNNRCFGVRMEKVRSLEGEVVCPVSFGQERAREPIEKGVFWLRGNPGDMYANMTQAYFSRDGRFASLDAQYILFPSGGFRFDVVYTFLIPLLNYCVTFDFCEADKKSGLCSNSLLGMHVPHWLTQWKFCVVDSQHIVRQSWGVHSYDGLLVLSLDPENRLKRTKHFSRLSSAIETGLESDPLLTWKETCSRPHVFIHPRIARTIVSPFLNMAVRKSSPRLTRDADRTTHVPSSRFSSRHRCSSLCQETGEGTSSVKRGSLAYKMIVLDVFNSSSPYSELTCEQRREVVSRKGAYEFAISALLAPGVVDHVREHGVSDEAVFEAYRYAAKEGHLFQVHSFSSHDVLADKKNKKGWYVRGVVDSLSFGRSILRGVERRRGGERTELPIPMDASTTRRGFMACLFLVGLYHNLPADPLGKTLCIPHLVFCCILFRYVSFVARDPASPFHGQVADLLLLWASLLSPLVVEEDTVLHTVMETVRLVWTSVLVERIVNEATGRTLSLDVGLIQTCIAGVTGVFGAWYVRTILSLLFCGWGFYRIPRSHPVTLVVETFLNGYSPKRGERHFVFQTDPINLVAVGVSVLVGYVFIADEYSSFLEDNPIRNRIGFNNMCVYFDLFPFSLVAGILLFGNVIGRFGHFLFFPKFRSITWPLVTLIPYYLLIFYVPPRESLLYHSLGYVLFILSEVVYMTLSIPSLTSPLSKLAYCVGIGAVCVYSGLAVVALGTDVHLPDWVLLLGRALDTFVLFLLVGGFVAHVLDLLRVRAIHVHVRDFPLI